jgi:transcriptional regulator with XRE-family HTH domain
LTIPPSQPGRASRAALAMRLTGLRTVAGLSGNALAKRMGVVQSRVWKIEHGDLMPAEQDIKEWMRATGGEAAAGELAELLAEARSEQAFSNAFARKGGAAAIEDRVRATEERSARIGEFEVAVIPGILQTADYAREVLSVSSGPRAWGSDDADVEDKIAGRLRRQEILYSRGKHVQVVLSEAALRVLVTTPETMAGQLDKLLAVSRLPAVELGVIGFGQRIPAYSIGGFRVYDDDLIVVESISEQDEITDPAKVAVYLGAFDALRRAAATGDEARRLITAAAADLRDERGASDDRG